MKENKTAPQACDCIEFLDGTWMELCANKQDCSQNGKAVIAAYWCGMMNERLDLRRNYRNVWCILRSIDQHEVRFSDPKWEKEWNDFRWAAFRENPHEYFLQAPDIVSDAIWAALEVRL